MGLCAFGFQVIPHPSCYFTSIMGKTHHGPLIVLFSVKLHRKTSVDTRAGASYVSLAIISLINKKKIKNQSGQSLSQLKHLWAHPWKIYSFIIIILVFFVITTYGIWQLYHLSYQTQVTVKYKIITNTCKI